VIKVFYSKLLKSPALPFYLDLFYFVSLSTAFSGRCAQEKLLTNANLREINRVIFQGVKGGDKNMSCGMKHPKAKKATKKAKPKKKK
jgi:hypothetical protein